MALGLEHLRFLAAAAAMVLGLWPGLATALDRLDFEVPGAEAAVAEAARQASLLLALQAQDQTSPQDLLAAARADYARILGALYAKGHYSAVIRITLDGREAASIPALDQPAAISHIVVSVDAGPLFRFGRTGLGPLAAGTTLPGGFQTGRPAESGLVGGSVDAAVLAWRETGHAKTGVGEERVVADHRVQVLDVDVTLDPGPKLRFGKLEITGETRMREARIAKIAGLPEGKTFSETALRRSEARLRRTGIFSSVTLVEDEELTAPDLLGITASVVEQKPRRYSFGAEVASLDGLSLTALWLHRNLLGGGERLQISGSATNIGAATSGADFDFGISLERPATFTPDTTAGVQLDYAHQDEIDYAVDSVSAGLTLSHVFSDRLTAQAGVTYDAQEGRDPGGNFASQSLLLPFGLIWDRRDVARDPKDGSYLEAEVMPFLGFSSTGSGLRATFDGRAYRSFGAGRGVTVAMRLQGGAVIGPTLLETPRDMLFFSGGAGTVRGQPYRSLGIPVTRDFGPEFQIGGQYFLAGSLELRADITDRIGVVGFIDAGSVGRDGFFDSLTNPHAGAGLGLRYDTGLGPLRLDVAAPVSGDTGDGVQIYIGLGQAF